MPDPTEAEMLAARTGRPVTTLSLAGDLAARNGPGSPLYDRDGTLSPVKRHVVALSPTAKAGGAGGAVASGGSTTVTLDTTIKFGDRNTIKVSGVSTTFTTMRWAVPSKRVTSRIGIRMLVDPGSLSASHTLAVSSDVPTDPPSAAPANRRELNILNPQIQKGVFCDYVQDVAAPQLNKGPGGNALAAFTVAAGAPDANLVNQIQMATSFNAGDAAAVRNVNYDRFYIDGACVPFVLLTFDSTTSDNSTSDTLKTWYKLLKDRDLVGTFFGDADKFIPANAATYDVLYAAGNDIAQQAGGGARGHYNYLTAYNNPAGSGFADTAAVLAALSADFETGLANLRAMGYTSCLDAMAWSQAGHNAPLDQVLYDKGVRFSRATDGPPRIVVTAAGAPQTINPGILVTTPHFQTDGVGNVGADFTAWTTDAVLHGTGFCTLTHTGTVAAAASNTETRISEMTIFLDDLAAKRDAGKLRVLTVSQYLKMIRCPRTLLA